MVEPVTNLADAGADEEAGAFGKKTTSRLFNGGPYEQFAARVEENF